MLAAPSRNAAQTSPGGPGRSSAAITSQSTSRAGATAAMPMTVGSDSSRFIWISYRRAGTGKRPTLGGLAKRDRQRCVTGEGAGTNLPAVDWAVRPYRQQETI